MADVAPHQDAAAGGHAMNPLDLDTYTVLLILAVAGLLWLADRLARWVSR